MNIFIPDKTALLSKVALISILTFYVIFLGGSCDYDLPYSNDDNYSPSFTASISEPADYDTIYGVLQVRVNVHPYADCVVLTSNFFPAVGMNRSGYTADYFSSTIWLYGNLADYYSLSATAYKDYDLCSDQVRVYIIGCKPVVLSGDTISEVDIGRNNTGEVVMVRLPYQGINNPDCITGIEDHSATLKQLYLYGNELNAINLSPLAACCSLYYLSLYKNRFQDIDLSPVINCPLTSINLSYNWFTSLDLSILSSCSTVSNLYLHYNQLSSINFPLENHLKYLTLNNNYLTTIDLTSFSTNACLQDICLDYNLLTNIDLSPIVCCGDLKCISLSHNQLTGIDLLPLAACSILSLVDLSKNSLQVIDLSPLAFCTDLDSMFLNYNLLSTLDLAPLWNLDDLEKLDLSYNSLDSATCQHVYEFIDTHPQCEVYTDCICR